MKKVISLMLIVILLLTMGLNVMADDTKNKSQEPILIQSQIFPTDNVQDSSPKADNQTDGVVTPLGDVYTPGTIRIDDVLQGEGGWMNGDNRSFSTFETFKYAAIKIATALPVVGDWISAGLDIYEALKSIYTDMVYIDNTKQVQVTTRFTYRDFYHYLYAWDYDNYWKSVGQSLSRYYYKYLNMWYYNTSVAEFRTSEYFYTHANGYSPFYISKAPNYMNYTQLRSNAYEAWLYNTKFNESYPNY